MTTSDRAYHVAELQIALDVNHPGRILPPPMPAGTKILDVGCGAGQSLIAAYPQLRSFGIDVDFDALRLGLTLTGNVNFACGRAERLPYASGTFDLVVARVSLPYSRLSQSLGEIRRVLRPGGQMWITLHTFSIPLAQARLTNPKSLIFLGYVVANTLAFHFTGHQFSLRGRCESFQIEGSIRRTLRRLGFDPIRIEKGRYFLVTAVVPETSP